MKSTKVDYHNEDHFEALIEDRIGKILTYDLADPLADEILDKVIMKRMVKVIETKIDYIIGVTLRNTINVMNERITRDVRRELGEIAYVFAYDEEDIASADPEEAGY